MDPKVVLGLKLLRQMDFEAAELKEVLEALELVTKVPALQREILERAQREGIFVRERNRVLFRERVLSDEGFDYPRIERLRAEGRCQRCGRRIVEQCFVVLDADERIGPLGSDCVKKVGFGRLVG